MSNEGDRAAVFRTTKVRTKLKGDASWLRCRTAPEEQTREEKPWIAEVRAGRVDGLPIETSPVSSPTTSTPSPVRSDAQRAPTSGFLIRGVFTKLENSPSSAATNGFSGTTQFTKRPSESYKRIAPHTVKSASENQEEDTLSNEEKEKRTEMASKVLKKSAVRQRSYVLSAAKIYEPKEKEPDPSLDNSNLSFMAKRVEITDDDESAGTLAPVSTPPPSAVTSAVSAPEPKPQGVVDSSDVTVGEPAAPKEAEAAPSPAREDPPTAPVTEKDPFADMKPGCTKVATPLPELLPELHPVFAPAICLSSDPDASWGSDPPLVELILDSTPPPPAQFSAVKEDTVETEPKSEPSPDPVSAVDTLVALSDTLVPFDTSSPSSKDNESVLAEEGGGSADSHAEDGVEQEPAPALSNCEPITEDLLALSDGPEEAAEPVPLSPGRWSQDLFGELEGLGAQREEEKQTDETAKETQSSADPFDPYPIGTTSPNSSSDLHQPLADISINSMSSKALESLADDVIPIDTNTTSTHGSWARTRETGSPQNTAESQKADQDEDQQTLVMFERKSNDNDSPWDRWTLPTVYTVSTTKGDEEEDEADEEEEESSEEPQAATTDTDIRETRSEPEPAMDRPVREEDQRAQTPESETKKGFVYVKEYVNAKEPENSTIDSSVNDSHSRSPSTYSRGSLSSACTFCGELVGTDARITIEHLNISCHPACFRCGVCAKPMGDLLYNMFLHGGKVHCESCYSKTLD